MLIVESYQSYYWPCKVVKLLGFSTQVLYHHIYLLPWPRLNSWMYNNYVCTNNVEIRTSFMNSKRNVRNYVNAFIIDYGMDTKPLIGISIERSITEFQWWRGKYICSFPMHQLFTVLSVAQLLLYRNEISTHFSGYILCWIKCLNAKNYAICYFEENCTEFKLFLLYSSNINFI